MKHLKSLATISVLLIALVIGAIGTASAGSFLPRAHIGSSTRLDASTDARPDIILVDRGARRQNRARANARRGNVSKRQQRRLNRQPAPQVKRHRRVRQHNRPHVKRHRRANRRSYRHNRRRRSGVYIGVYPYYDPFYDYGYYDYRYYDAPTYYRPAPVDRRLSCTRVRNKLRRKGYHRVRAYDCKGKTYVFYARSGGKNYRLRVNAYSGKIKSLRRL